MKASELMIGDWIRMNKYQNVRVSRLSEHSDYPNCEPIPLTPEILEKNGAKHSVYEHPYFDVEPSEEELNDALQYYPFHNYKLWEKISITFYPKEIRVEVFGQDFVDVFKIRGRKGDVYVHELQHALRLCGISKEIIL